MHAPTCAPSASTLMRSAFPNASNAVRAWMRVLRALSRFPFSERAPQRMEGVFLATTAPGQRTSDYVSTICPSLCDLDALSSRGRRAGSLPSPVLSSARCVRTPVSVLPRARARILRSLLGKALPAFFARIVFPHAFSHRRLLEWVHSTGDDRCGVARNKEER